MSDNLALWHSVEKTDPSATKSFTGRGGFRGTQVDPMHLIRRATELWGPMGGTWGIKVIEESIHVGAAMFSEDGTRSLGFEQLHVARCELFHPGGSLPCFGCTLLVWKNKHGTYTDEDAPKKSLTDALSKGLSWLGFAADIHTGRYDDAKYVAAIRDEFNAAHNGTNGHTNGTPGPDPLAEVKAKLEAAATQGIEILKAQWAKVPPDAQKKLVGPFMDALKQKAMEAEHAASTY